MVAQSGLIMLCKSVISSPIFYSSLLMSKVLSKALTVSEPHTKKSLRDGFIGRSHSKATARKAKKIKTPKMVQLRHTGELTIMLVTMVGSLNA